MRGSTYSRPTRPANHPPGFRAGVLAVLDDLGPVDEDVLHSGGVLVGFDEGGVVLDRGGIEDDHIGEVALPQQPAAVELEVGGGQAGELADRLFEGKNLLVADVLARGPGRSCRRRGGGCSS